MTRKKVRSKNTELPKGAKLTLTQGPLRTGVLYIFQVGALFILGRWSPGWIIQPHRWIEVGRAAVKVLGQVSRMVL
jgi:hypothetical protein